MSLAAISLLVQPSRTSMPIIRPRPRVLPKQGRFRASMPLRRYSPPANDLEAIRAQDQGDVCAVMVELVQGEGGWTSFKNPSLRVS